jgi:hypothetical protein
MNGDIVKRVKEIQASMVGSAKSCFEDLELNHLRALIRLTVEFYDWLESGSVDIAAAIQQGPFFSKLSAEFREDVRNASADPFNKYDVAYACASILSGIDSFVRISQTYKILEGATASKVKWDMISSRESFKTQYVSMFNEFTEEANFENKCRLLLDLFKLQIIFVGISYDWS